MAEHTGRCEAFSDGVFAIAITLLILEIRLPHVIPEGGLWGSLAGIWPSYLAFALSFFVIIVTWLNHHDFMRLLRAVNHPFLLANGFVLLYVTFVPFPTAVLAEHLAGPEARAAVALYCGTFVLGGIAWNLLFHVAVRNQLFHPEVDARKLSRVSRSLRLGLGVNVAAMLLALVLPMVALALTFGVRLLWLTLPLAKARQVPRPEPQPAP